MGSYALKRLQAADAKRKAEEEKKNETVTAIDAATSETLKSNMQAKKDAAEAAKIDQSGLKKKSVQYKKEREEFSDVADFPSEAEIRADVARKQLEMYKNSDEKRRNDEKRLQDKYAQQLLYGITDSSEVLYDEDPREKELQAEADYWDGKVKQEADEKLFASNMQEIQNLSGAERTAFEIYANNRTFVDPENLEAFKKLKERYGDKLQDLKATYQRNKDEQAARTMAEKTAAKVEQGGFLANIGRNILSLGANLAGGVTGAAGRINELFNGTGPYETAAKYTAGDILGVYGQTVQDKTAEQILGGQEMNLGDGISGRELGALAYQGGMGALESVARLVAAGGNPFVAAGLAASQTFSSTVQEATEKGATPQQAYALAVTNAGIEALTEKLPFDNLMNIVKGGANPKVIVNLLLQAGVEIGEEEASLIGTTLAEAAILREKSDYQQTIGKATAMGVPYEQAVAEADRALLEEAKQTALVSGFSGFLSAGGAEYANSRFAGTSTERQQTAQQPRTTQQEQAPNQTEQAAQPVQAAPAAEEAVDFVAETARQQAQMVPPEVKEPMPEGLRHFDNAAAIANGITPESQGVQQGQETAASEETAAFKNPTREELSAKPDIPVIEVRANSDSKTYQQMKADVFNTATLGKWYDTPRINADTGMPVFLSKNTFTHAFSNLTAEHGADTILAASNAPALIENAVLVNTAPPKNPQKAESKVHTFMAAIRTETGVKPVKITVKEYDVKKENRLPQNILNYFKKTKPETQYQKAYDIKALEVVDIQSVKNEFGASADAIGSHGQPTETSTPNSTIRVADLLDLVKGDAEKYIPKPASIDSTSKADTQIQSADGGQNKDFRDSNTFMNSGLRSENPNIREGYRQDLKVDPDAAKYAVKHNADTLAEANRRVSTPEAAGTALEDLLSRTNWTAEDVATSTLLLDQVMASGDRNAIEKLSQLRQQRKDVLSNYGQTIQAVTIGNETMHDAASPATAVDTFRTAIDGMNESDTTYSRKTGVDFDTWKNNIKTEVDRIGIAIATVEDGDNAQMIDIINQIARSRKTTAWFGTSDRISAPAMKVLKNLGFEDLKKIANTQIVAMADDYRKRNTKEVVSGLRKQSMLSSLKTVIRNLGGNAAGGLADSFSESTSGRLADIVLSQFTGKKTIGNDISLGKEYLAAAKDAGQFASLCVELNIPIETDIDASFNTASGRDGNSKYVGRTFRATGNPAMRAMYAYQKYMSYALEVTDKVFEGGTNAAVTESLNRLKNANLTDEDVTKLGEFTANKRTFKNSTWEENAGNGKTRTRGSELARFADSVKNAGGDTLIGEGYRALADVAAPFTNVPMNVAQTGIDYTAGVAKGVGEMISIIKDAKAGKTIPVERQRQAASDFGRGVTGITMIGLFTAAAASGALKAAGDEDWDKEALAQSEGRSGAQINWDAIWRGLNGESTDWQSGDTITSLDFLEPFNTQMYLGYEIAQSEDMNVLTYAGATLKSIWNSLMDSPVMTGLSDIVDLIKEFTEAENPADIANAAAAYVGDVASSFIPQFVRQTAQYTDGYYRDTTGDTPIESAVNKAKASLPGLSQTLPVKYDGLGQVQKRGGFVNTFIDPTNTTTYQENPVTSYLDTLSENTGNTAIYPDRQAPRSIMVNGEEILISGKEMTETYQKTYGENVNSLYSGLMENDTFRRMSDEEKTDALLKAKEYATKLAKASVSEYRDAPTESTDQLVQKIIGDTAESRYTSAFNDLTNAWKYNESTDSAVDALDQAYRNYTAMSQQDKTAFTESASGRMKYFIDAKKAGILTETFTDMYKRYQDIDKMDAGVTEKAREWSYALEKAVDAGTITEKQKDVLKKDLVFRYSGVAETAKFDEMIEGNVPTDVADMVIATIKDLESKSETGSLSSRDTYSALAGLDVDEAVKDEIMRTYIPDYDPEAKQPTTTEIKYDYIRQEMGLSAEDFAEAYGINSDGGAWRSRAAKMSRELGISTDAAYDLIEIFEGKKKNQLIDWYKQQ